MARIFFDRRDFEAVRSLGEADTVEYRPSVDVIETAAGIEIVADLPGIPAESVHVSFTGGTVVISGRKRPFRCVHREAAFHLAERTFGHFACVVRCEVAVDAGRARATLASGELRIVLPRIDERRGRAIAIPVEAASGPATP